MNYASDLEAPDRGSMANRGRIAGMSIQKESDENDYSDSNSHNERQMLSRKIAEEEEDIGE